MKKNFDAVSIDYSGYNAMLRDRVEAAQEPVFMTRKADIIDYFKDTFGAKNWTSKAAAALSGTTDKKSRAYQSAMRNFQGGRENTEPKASKDKQKWADFGKKLPPTGKKPPKNGYNVSVVGAAKISERWVNVHFSQPIAEADAQAFTDNPTYEQVFDAYLHGKAPMPSDYVIDSLGVDAL